MGLLDERHRLQDESIEVGEHDAVESEAQSEEQDHRRREHGLFSEPSHSMRDLSPYIFHKIYPLPAQNYRLFNPKLVSEPWANFVKVETDLSSTFLNSWAGGLAEGLRWEAGYGQSEKVSVSVIAGDLTPDGFS